MVTDHCWLPPVREEPDEVDDGIRPEDVIRLPEAGSDQSLATVRATVSDVELLGDTLGLDIEIEGFTIARLMRERNMKPIPALLTMDWFLREPKEAAKTVRRGHDYIGKPKRKE